MTVVGQAYIEVLPLTTAFDADLAKQVQAAVDKTVAENKKMFEGLVEQANVAGEGVAKAMTVAADQTAAAGAKAAEGARVATASTAASIDEAAARIAAGTTVAGTGAKRMAEDTEKGMSEAEKSAAKGGTLFERFFRTIGGGFSGIGRTAANWGLPFSESLVGVGERLGSTEGKASNFLGKVSTMGGVITTVGAVALAGFSAEAVHLGDNMNAASAQIANAAGISVAAAGSITKAFENTGGQTEASAGEMANAYAQVAGQLGTVAGHALNAKQATDVMLSSADLADAKLGNLNQTTVALAKVMQAYGLSTSQAGATSDELFNISRTTGVGLSSLTQTLQRMHSQLGALTPSIGQVGGLTLDLAQHGETGRQALAALGTALTTLLKVTPPAATATKDLTAQHIALDKANLAVSTSAAHLAAAEAAYTKAPTAAHAASLRAAQNALAAAHLNVASATDKLNKALEPTAAKLTAAQAEAKQLGLDIYNSSGKFVGMDSVIAQLQPKLAKMSQSQQLAAVQALFGASAGTKLLDVILAGPKAYDASTAAVTRAGTAHKAAEAQMHTLGGEGKVLGAALEDLATKWGQMLLPILTDAAHILANVVGWFEKHKAAAIALAAIIGGALAFTVGVFLVNKIADMVAAVGRAGTSLGAMGSKMLGLGSNSEETATTVDEAQAQMTAAIQKLSENIGALVEQSGTAAGELETDFDMVSETALTSFENASTAMDQFIANSSAMTAEVSANFASMQADADASLTGIDLAIQDVAATAEIEGPATGLALDSMLGPIGLIMLGATLLLTHWKQVWGAVKEAALAVWHWLESNWETVVEIIIALIVPGGLFIAAFMRWHDQILQIASDVINAIVGFFESLPGKILRALEALGNMIATFLTGTVLPFFERLPGQIVGALADLGSMIWDFLTGTVLPFVVDFLATVVGWWLDLPLRLISAIFSLGTLIWNFLGSQVGVPIDNFLAMVVGWFEHLPGRFMAGLQVLAGDIAGFFQNKVLPGISSFIATVLGFFTALPGNILKGISSLGSQIGDFFTKKVEPVVKAPLNLVITGINYLIQGADDIAGLFGLKDVIPKIPKLARGGITDGPAVLVGEGNPAHPEYVIASDPAYRAQNQRLAVQAAKAVGLPGFQGGGIFGHALHAITGGVGSALHTLGSLAGGVVSTFSGWEKDVEGLIRQGAADAVVQPLFDLVNGLTGSLPPFFKDMVKGLETDVLNWVKGKVTGPKLQGGIAGALAGDIGAHGASASANQRLASTLVPARWSTGIEWEDLLSLWNRESGWNQFAKNPTSGAYGIPQALPASKMASAGPDWLTNPATQIQWGIGYIQGRYGDPVGAWAHEMAVGWYDQGGFLPPGISVAVNNTGRPEPVGAARGGITIEAGAVVVEQTFAAGTSAADAETIRRATQEGVTDALNDLMERIDAANPGGHPVSYGG